MQISENKMRHINGVAEYMYWNADKYDLDKDDMFLLGMLHDVGYLYGSEGHSEEGAKLLCKNRYVYAWAVAWHGKTPKEYLDAVQKTNVPKALILLWEADLSIDGNGDEVGFDARLEDIKKRYGENSRQYNAAAETIKWLRERMGC